MNASDVRIDASIAATERLTNYYPVMPPEELGDAPDVHVIVEKMPEFPGGIAAMMNYFGKSIRYPLAAREQNIQGRVFLNFVVEKDGSISNVVVLRGIGGGCDEEAVRVVQEMPKWNPGLQNGKAVRVSFNLPVRFGLR
jgi:protein TonB